MKNTKPPKLYPKPTESEWAGAAMESEFLKHTPG